MRLILFGASGMVGAGVLREALSASEVTAVLSVGRRPCGVAHPKLQELLIEDLFDVTAVESKHAQALRGYDACVWAIGVSSVGLDEKAYAWTTEELTLRWAEALLRLNPQGFSFCYCSAMGAEGRSMWARVRRRVESALKAMPFRNVGVVRPGFIQPGPGIRSRTWGYQLGLTLFRPLFPLVMRLMPKASTTSEQLGRAMLQVVQGRSDRYVLECEDINRLGART